VNALSGKTVTANIGTPLVAIDQKNVNSASVQKKHLRRELLASPAAVAAGSLPPAATDLS